MKIYLSGAISRDDNYKEKFQIAESQLKAAGFAVMSPAILPSGFDYEDYMTICLAMIDVCKTIALLPDWENSIGALRERTYAMERGYKVYEYSELF